MGKTTKPSQVGTADLSTPQQKQYVNQGLGQNTNQASQAYGNFLQPYDPQQFNDLFQKSFVNPAMMNYEQNVLPSIQQSFGDANAGSSSALNQALASSAQDLSTSLGGQMGNFYQQYQQNQLGALGQLGGMSGQRLIDPIIQQGYNPTGDALGALGTLGAAGITAYGAMSSIKCKENIKEFSNGLKAVEEMQVKTYDYKEEYGGDKDQIGMIAESLPVEYTQEVEGILHVNLYSLLSTGLKAIQELNEKVSILEKKCEDCKCQ